ncbi:MAG: hypothetical protein V4594_17670 [Bacteroidota bacterium]
MNEFTITAIGMGLNAGIKILCFILGYRTIKLGYQLMRDGIKGEFNFSGDYKGMKGGLASSSPGLLFLLLGICLIAYAMAVDKTISMSAKATVNNERTLPNEDIDSAEESIMKASPDSVR